MLLIQQCTTNHAKAAHAGCDFRSMDESPIFRVGVRNSHQDPMAIAAPGLWSHATRWWATFGVSPSRNTFNGAKTVRRMAI